MEVRISPGNGKAALDMLPAGAGVVGDFGRGRSRERCRGGTWYAPSLIEVNVCADLLDLGSFNYGKKGDEEQKRREMNF